jgi:hypothetical protein
MSESAEAKQEAVVAAAVAGDEEKAVVEKKDKKEKPAKKAAAAGADDATPIQFANPEFLAYRVQQWDRIRAEQAAVQHNGKLQIQ